jgi:hypothetical protein
MAETKVRETRTPTPGTLISRRGALVVAGQPPHASIKAAKLLGEDPARV